MHAYAGSNIWAWLRNFAIITTLKYNSGMWLRLHFCNLRQSFLKKGARFETRDKDKKMWSSFTALLLHLLWLPFHLLGPLDDIFQLCFQMLEKWPHYQLVSMLNAYNQGQEVILLVHSISSDTIEIKVNRFKAWAHWKRENDHLDRGHCVHKRSFDVETGLSID